MFQTKSITSFVLLLVCLLGFSVRAGATDPTYSVGVGGGSFSPNPITSGTTATASLTASLNFQTTSKEISESGDTWTWSAVVTGYGSSQQAGFGPVPSGITPPSVSATSGSATTTVSATAGQTTSPGYYQITATATDNFNINDISTTPTTVTPASASGSTTLGITVAKVDIAWNNSVITNSTISTIIVGQGVQLQALVQPSDLLPNPIPNGYCTWTVAGAVYGYTAVNTSSQCIGVVINLSSSNPNGLSSATPHFYWVKGGSQSVSLQISGMPGTVQATFVVQRPTGANVSPVPGTVSLDLDSNGVFYLHDGVNRFPYSGMEWDFTIDNTYPGQWQYVQLVQSTSRVYTEASGSTWSIHSPSVQGPSSNPVLDTNLPYTFVPNPSTGMRQGDSPSSDVNPLTLMPAYPSSASGTVLNDVVKASVSDSFKDWLMFRPTGTDAAGTDSIPVPIGTFTWNWYGQTSRTISASGQSSQWSPNAGSVAGKSIPGSYADEQSTFPQWNANIKQRYYAQP